MALSNRQLKFKNNLLEGMTPKDAYMDAGYSKNDKTAAKNSSRLMLKNAEFRRAYEEGLEQAANKAEVSKSRVLLEDSHIAFSDIAGIFDANGILLPPKDIPAAIRRSISSIKVVEHWDPKSKKMLHTYEYRFWDKGKAIERLSKHLGMFEKDNMQRLDSSLLNILLAGLPKEYADKVKAALVEKVGK
jgi:phage terminase small subunit